MQAMKVPEFADVGKNDECVNRLLETCQADVANKRWYEAANVYARWLEINWKFDFEEPEWKPTEKIQVSDHGIYVEFTLHGKKIVIENTTNQGGGSITALIRAINDKMWGTKAISVSDYSVEDRKTWLDALREVSTEVATNKCHELGILVEWKSLETLRWELASKGEHDIIPAFEGLNRENGKHQEAIWSAKLNVQWTMIHTRSHSRDSLEAGIKAIIIWLIPFFEKHINVFSTPDAEWWHKYVHGES